MRALGTLVAILLCGGAVTARADDHNTVDQLFIDGRALLDSNPKEACEKFEKAQALQPGSVAILLNLGVCHEKQTHLASALKWYRLTLTAAAVSKDPSAKDYVEAATTASAKLADHVAKLTITFAAGTDNVTVYIDGAKVDKNVAVELDAGDHVMEARAPGKTTTTTNITAKDDAPPIAQTVAPLADLPEVPLPRGKRRLLGVGILVGATVVVSVISGVWAHGVVSDMDQGAAKSSQTKATVVWFAGVALGVGIGSYLFFTKPKKHTERMALVPVITPKDAGFSLFRRF